MVAVNYLWNPLNDNIVREFDDAGAAVAEYTTEPAPFGNVVSQRHEGQESNFHYDGIGSTLALTNEAGTLSDTAEYTAFGNVVERSGATVFPYQFVGQMGYYLDEVTAECCVRRRHLSVKVDRWLSLDPVGGVETNRYLAVSNAPISFVDPSGEIVICFCAAQARKPRLTCKTVGLMLPSLTRGSCRPVGGGGTLPSDIACTAFCKIATGTCAQLSVWKCEAKGWVFMTIAWDTCP